MTGKAMCIVLLREKKSYTKLQIGANSKLPVGVVGKYLQKA